MSGPEDEQPGALRHREHLVDDLLTVWRSISRPQLGQCGWPMRANSSRR